MKEIDQVSDRYVTPFVWEVYSSNPYKELFLKTVVGICMSIKYWFKKIKRKLVNFK